MLDNKQFWYGLGLGLIVASVFLGILGDKTEMETEPIPFNSPSEDLVISSDNWTEETVKEKASELGLAVYPVEEVRYSEDEVEQLRKQLEAAKLEVAELETDKTAEKIYILRILSGMSLLDVAGMLEDSGLIDDGESLIARMVQENLQYQVKTGVVQIKEGTNIEEIVQLLTDTEVVASE